MNEANAFVRGDLTEEEYRDFVSESVRRFSRHLKYWQLGHEFDIFHREGPAAYTDSQRVGYLAAKEADPDCIVIGGSITELQVRREGFREPLQLGLAKWCDIYDFHFYADLRTTQELLDYIHAQCAEFGAIKPIWVTETTQVSMFEPDDRNQAEYVFKRYAHLLANGVSVVFWHALCWPYPYSADRVPATALVDCEGFARPSLFAYAALTRELGGARFAKRRDAGEDVYALEFARGDRSLLVLWSEVGQRELRVRCAAGEVWQTSVSGRRAVLGTTNGVVILTAGRSPVIYDLPK